MRFYLGAHHPSWLPDSEVPLFVSHRRLIRQVRWPRAGCRWALDSGAFSEISTKGEFEFSPRAYTAAIRRCHEEIGNLDWAAPQDHMTEPWVLARSHLADTVEEAQRWTVANLLELRWLSDGVTPIIPVLQGQTLADYLRHVDLYARAGIELEAEELVGLGSVCRRQATRETAEIVAALAPLRLHGFGVKTSGFGLYRPFLASADSMAWSYDGRRGGPCPERPVKNCANCRHHALAWREQVLRARPLRGVQMAFAL